ncbi:hypothetical protein ACS8Y6_01865 [Salinisphaera sp. RV14]|uniref:hypothetical protein n=1 Tax=unclassified Salinisphaera TaxID=2649847 RepID=UPI003F854682
MKRLLFAAPLLVLLAACVPPYHDHGGWNHGDHGGYGHGHDRGRDNDDHGYGHDRDDDHGDHEGRDPDHD